MYDLDYGKVFDDVLQEGNIEYRDPLLDPYGNTALATPTQKEAWAFFHKYRDQTYTTKDGVKHQLAPLIGMIGAKGSSKTHWGACFAWSMAQHYPGSMGCLISNTYQQAKDNGPPILIKVGKSLGYEVEFFTNKKINGRQYTNVYVLRLTEGVESYLLIRSFDSVDNLEGSEIDWGWAEEIQDASKSDLTVFISRVRGGQSPNSIFCAGMPENGTHWQYKLLPALGFQEQDNFSGIREKEMVDPETGEKSLVPVVGVLYEPSVFENKQNVGVEYINRLLELYSKEDAERYVYGRRGSSRSDRVFYQYRDDLHRTGLMSELLCQYDPKDKLVISYDFNVYPMSVSVWQPKMWSDKWDDLVQIDDRWIHAETGEDYESPEEYAAPDRKVWAQVDELEVYPDDPKGGMTRGMVAHVEERYIDHDAMVLVLGDASGNQRRSSSTTTDWQIIGESMRRFKQPVVKRGLIANSDLKSGRTKYSNPPQRDALQNANRFLMDGKGQAHVCFLPESKLPSGGVAASVSALGFNSDGSFDIKSERKKDRDVARSHFADTFKYFAYWALPPQKTTGKADVGGYGDEDSTKKARRRLQERREEEQELQERGGWAW